MEKLMKIWLFLFTIYLILYVVDMIGDRDYGRYVSIGKAQNGQEYGNAYYKILDKRTGNIRIK